MVTKMLLFCFIIVTFPMLCNSGFSIPVGIPSPGEKISEGISDK